MAFTVKDFKKMLSVKRDDDIVCINDMVIELAEIDNAHAVDKATNIIVYSLGELSNDNIRKARLRAVGVNVK